eukprot:CAMPEP_0178390334 /NCGR_PEP_ID=MMETSP0689_2-20121128/10593_1 /TAXON_ID=160604 /ORGANISM="Amphidinium massartii, Strain CS-259" /LENGTH=794 /DNA_ID=CAMNT_0020010841 /DNA_START=57 /DNA_END=2438 /DNA_ORIENTATION=-
MQESGSRVMAAAAAGAAAVVVAAGAYRLYSQEAELRQLRRRAQSPPRREVEKCQDARGTAVENVSREVPLVPPEAALLVIDMQNYCCHPQGGQWAHGKERPSNYYLKALPSVLGNIRALLLAARAQRVECIFTTIESLTKDGRDRSLDYKISGFNVPKGSWDAQVVDEIAPQEDEIVLPKCSSSVFMSTNIAYKLRNLGISQVVIVGGLTDQCVDSAVRDACDAGFLVTVVTDAVITHSAARHASSLHNNKGYARQRTTEEVLAELGQPSSLAAPVSPWSCSGVPQGSSTQSGLSTAIPSSTSQETLDGRKRLPQTLPVCPAPGQPHRREYVRFEIVDMNGKALSKLIPARHCQDTVYLYSGALALGANSEVLTVPPEILKAGCPNAPLVPDWATAQVLPWAAQSAAANGPEGGVVIKRVYCEQRSVRGTGAMNGAVPRTVCKRLLRKLEEDFSLRFLSASELEFCLADGEKWDEPAFSGPEIFVTLQGSKVSGFMCAVEDAMASVDVDIRTMNPEYGAGQLEITFLPKWGIESGDAASTFRTGVKELAQQRGMLATFQAKPFAMDGPGNGGHFNFSLWKKATDALSSYTPAGTQRKSTFGELTNGWVSALHDATAPSGLSVVGQHFLAGVLAHAPALEALCSPTPACYLRHGNWAPVCANYGPDDRLCAVRVKAGAADGDGGDCYFELRMPSASACAYLVIAGIVAAGMDGLRKELPLPRPRQTEADGATKLPTSLTDALEALEADAYMVSELGSELVEWFTLLKRSELEAVEARIAARSNSKTSNEAKLEAW